MTVLTKIRNKSGLLVTIIAIALLMFILQSAFESGNSFFGGNRSRVAVINGNDITIEEFSKKIEQAEENEKQRTGRSALDEGTKDNLRMQVWNQTINQFVIQPRYEKLGIGVSAEELFDMVQGKDPHPQVKEAFKDQNTKMYDPKLVMNFLKNMEKDETGDTKNRWVIFESAIKDERQAQKYTNMVKNGFYTTKAEAKRAYENEQRKLNLRFVAQKYSDVPDSTIVVSEEETRKYYNENKNKFKQKETVRAIDYVEFEVQPSAEDRMAVAQAMNKLKPEFQLAEVDSDFVNSNADTRYVEKIMSPSSMNPFMDTFNTAPLKTVIGPYFENNAYKIAKLSGIKMSPDSVKARHILFSAREKTEIPAARQKADSTKKLLEGGAKFDVLAPILSQDPGSAAKGGDLGYFKEGTMVKPFNDACFDGKIGDLQIVETQFGVHLIEVTAKSAASRKLIISYVDRAITPSSQTYNAVYNQASQFAGKNREKDLFEKAIKDQKLNKRSADALKDIDRIVNGMENAREVVRWAYQAKKGEVSPVFQLGDKYIVCLLSRIKEKGILPLEEVKTIAEAEAKKIKKAEKFEAEMNKAKSSGNLDQVAGVLKATVESSELVSFTAPNMGTMGRELNVVGKLCASKANVLTGPLRGENGVYLVQINSFSEIAPNSDNYKASREVTLNSVKQRVDYEIFDALKEKAEIEDNRAVFY